MNFSVVRSADTYWGRNFAMELARNGRHLLLIGSNFPKLQTLSDEIRDLYNVKIHSFGVATDDIKDVIKICDQINAHFEVDFLLNYAEINWNSGLQDNSVFQLTRDLTACYLASPVFTHQLLPNLMLHANACVLELGCTSQAPTPMQESVKLFNSSFSTQVNQEMLCSGFSVKVCQTELPWIDTDFLKESLAERALTGMAERLLSTFFPEHFLVGELLPA